MPDVSGAQRLGKDFEGTLAADRRHRLSEDRDVLAAIATREYAAAGRDETRGDAEEDRGGGAGVRELPLHFRELKENLDERIAYAKELGLKQMVLSSFGLRPEATMADWPQAATEMNRVGGRDAQGGAADGVSQPQ